MLSERNQPYHQQIRDKISENLPNMKEMDYIPNPRQQFSQNGMIVATQSENADDLQIGDLKRHEENPSYIVKRSQFFIGNIFSSLYDKLRNVAVGSGTISSIPGPPGRNEKEQQYTKTIVPATPCIPIFETIENGTGQLTVPLDYGSTVDDILMTPAGVYREELLNIKNSATRPGLIRKQRKQHRRKSQPIPTADRKDKHPYDRQRDIQNDKALSVDDCYGYDYRDAVHVDTMDTQSLPLRDLVASFSPSSVESVESFYDALQDILTPFHTSISHSCMSLSDVRNPKSTDETQQNIPASVPDTSNVDTFGDLGSLQCDNDPDRSGFVVFTDYDVFATPSASPARRRPSHTLCKAFSFVWHRQDSDESEDEDDEEVGDKISCSSEDSSDEDCEDGIHFDYDNEGDDDCVIFCDDYDENDDTNSSSGFEERKVRFNFKPVVHVMRAWDFAYRQARKGDWETAARDRERFRKRIADLEPVLGAVLQSELRDKIYNSRFSGMSPDENTRATC